MKYPVRHATFNGNTTLCGIYGGWHSPKILVKPVEGWERVTCKRCRKSPLFKKSEDAARMAKV